MDATLHDLVEAADLNGLLRAVDGLCSARAWEELLDLAEACEAALDRGKQLWPIAAHVDYRIALEAPGDYAAGVLTSEPSRFVPGPLTEVAASTHRWEELAPYIETPQAAAFAGQERVLRGERLDGDDRAHPEVLELPLHLEEWEPTYPLATFKADHVEVAEPWDPMAPLEPVTARPAPALEDPDLVNALLDLVQPWTTESNGAARAAIVEGDAIGAASNLTFGPLNMGRLRLDEALQRLAWAAASGGAHGRRRGAAFGRSMAWYTASLLADVGWPADPATLSTAADALEWHRWDEGEAEEGWVLRIAVHDPANGWSAAIVATDLLEEG